MAYPLVKIDNTTDYFAVGDVCYASAFCKNDSYLVEPNKTWEASSRGICLVTKITANVSITPENYVVAKEYTSSGTSYSHFEIREIGEESFEVVRI